MSTAMGNFKVAWWCDTARTNRNCVKPRVRKSDRSMFSHLHYTYDLSHDALENAIWVELLPHSRKSLQMLHGTSATVFTSWTDETHPRIQILHCLRQNFSSILRPVRTTGELIYQSRRKIVVCLYQHLFSSLLNSI